MIAKFKVTKNLFMEVLHQFMEKNQIKMKHLILKNKIFYEQLKNIFLK